MGGDVLDMGLEPGLHRNSYHIIRMNYGLAIGNYIWNRLRSPVFVGCRMIFVVIFNKRELAKRERSGCRRPI